MRELLTANEVLCIESFVCFNGKGLYESLYYRLDP